MINEEEEPEQCHSSVFYHNSKPTTEHDHCEVKRCSVFRDNHAQLRGGG